MLTDATEPSVVAHAVSERHCHAWPFPGWRHDGRATSSPGGV